MSGLGSTEPPGRRRLAGAGPESAGGGSAGAGAGRRLVASRPLHVLEQFRVPYSVSPDDHADGLERVRLDDGPAIVWPRERGLAGAYRLDGIPLFGTIADDDLVERLLAAAGGSWLRDRPLLDRAGSEVAWTRRAEDGSIFLPFDPDEVIAAFWSEGYVEIASGGAGRVATSMARRAYYVVRPILPRRIQLALRRRFLRVQEQASFPSWPAETALHDLCRLLLGFVDEIAGEPLPRLAAWPDGFSWALVLTHDIERAPGYGHLNAVLEVERRADLRSACFFVPERDYAVEEGRVRELTEAGFEVGVHGLRHDGRDLARPWFDRRLPAMQAYRERWGASGFRSPATQRSWELVSRLGFDYDTSYCDVARYEPQAGGSCSWLPFFVGDVVELPITLPMDHTLFELLGHGDGSVWLEKASFLRNRGGMALMLTHPDYLLDPSRLQAYAHFLEQLAGDETLWHALPREVSAWWRRRDESTIERDGDEWRVVGPAAGEARLELGPLPS